MPQSVSAHPANFPGHCANVAGRWANTASQRASFAGQRTNLASRRANVANRWTNFAGRRECFPGCQAYLPLTLNLSYSSTKIKFFVGFLKKRASLSRPWHRNQFSDFSLAKPPRFAEIAKFLFAKPLFSLSFSVTTIIFVVIPFEFLCALCVSSRLCERLLRNALKIDFPASEINKIDK